MVLCPPRTSSILPELPTYDLDKHRLDDSSPLDVVDDGDGDEDDVDYDDDDGKGDGIDGSDDDDAAGGGGGGGGGGGFRPK